MAKEKDVVVSFRVDKHLADILNAVPDKSAFIRSLILKGYYETCPICRGRGLVPDELARWAASHVKKEKLFECECCRYSFPSSCLASEVVPKRGRSFTCPHCQDHDHGH